MTQGSSLIIVRGMSIETIKATLRQYLSLKGEADLITNRVNELKKRLTEDVESYGEENANGHFNLTVEDSVKGEVKLTKQKRVSNPLDIVTAERILSERGIREQCIKMVPQLDDQAILAAHYQGKLSEADIDAMFPPKVTWAFIVKTND